jgi:hypothetical protein
MLLAVAPRAGVASAQKATDEPAIALAVGYLNDRANVLDEPTRGSSRASSIRWRGRPAPSSPSRSSTAPAPLTPTEYKTKVFDAWKIGAHGKDNGLLMLVALAEHEVRFETGYGLEGVLPDGLRRASSATMAPLPRERHRGRHHRRRARVRLAHREGSERDAE